MASWLPLVSSPALSCTDNRSRRWHPLIIRWCFQLYSSSPKAYQFLKDNGVLLLPDKRTLRDYSNCFKVDFGFESDFLHLVKKDFINRPNPIDYDAWVGIIHDEVSLRKDLVFDDSGKLIALFKNELGSGASFAPRRLLGSVLGTELVVCQRNEANLNCLHRYSSTYC